MPEAPNQPGDAASTPPATEVKVTVEPPTDWRRVHLWHIQPVRDALVILMVLGIFQLGYALRAVTVPLLLAVLLAYLFEPLVERMTRGERIGRPVAAGVIIGAIVIGIGGPVLLGLGFGAVQAVSYTQTLAVNAGKLRASLAEPNNAMLADALPDRWRPFRDFLVGIDTTPHTEPRDQQTPDQKTGDQKTGDQKAGDQQAGDQKPVDQKTGDQKPADKPAAPAETDQPPAKGDEPTTVDEKTGQPAAAAPPDPRQAEIDEQAERRPVERLLAWSSEYLRVNAEAIAKFVGRGALGTGAEAVQAAINFVKRSAMLGFSLFLTLFFLFFVSSGWPRVKRSALELIPRWSRARTLDILGKMDRVIAAFIRGRLMIAAIMSVTFVITYWLIGVPAALLVGMAAGILSIVPYLPLLTIPACWLLMWLQPVGPEWQQTWWWIVFAPPVAYFLAQNTDDYIWTPRIQGKATDMDTPTILFAVLAGATLAGFYGVLVAIPVGACLKILIREAWYPRFRAWAEGRVLDILPISRYSPTEAKGETKPS